MKCLGQNEGQSLALQVDVLYFLYVAPYQNQNDHKATGIENRGKNFALFDSRKFRQNE